MVAAVVAIPLLVFDAGVISVGFFFVFFVRLYFLFVVVVAAADSCL
jgi:hypothetical protein